MADLKISALPAATAPLAGTEVLPIVQGGVTTKVAVSDLTAGRAVSATQLTSTVAIGTAPLVVTSTTNVANLNASSLNGATFAAPGVIGGGTASAISATTVNKVTITAPATASTLTIADGKTLAVNDNATLGTGGLTLGNSGGFTAAASKVLTASNTLTLVGTDATTHTFPTTSATIARTDAAQTFTGDQTISAGNLIPASGYGIDFSATPGTGTSELLADYEEGACTLTAASETGSITSYTVTGIYTKIGRLVTVYGVVKITNAGTASGRLDVSGLPFTINASEQPVGAAQELFSTGVFYGVTPTVSSTTCRINSLTATGVVWLANYWYGFQITYAV
jgi:hypothetical protein